MVTYMTLKSCRVDLPTEPRPTMDVDTLPLANSTAFIGTIVLTA